MRALEDLVNAVRDPEPRRYLAEAVRAYQAGALRSAVVATWVAVALDLVAKLREVAAVDGAGAAAQFVNRLDGAIENADRPALATIERELLTEARDRFELIEAREEVELQRLRADRHICAHPAFVRPDDVFEPTPELVRVHIATAVDAVLSKGPIPGRKAIQRFQLEVRGESFPDALDALVDYLRDRYFQRGKSSLRRGLAELIIKGCLEPPDADRRAGRRCSLAAHALDRIEPEVLKAALTAVIGRREEGRGLLDSELLNFVGRLGDLSVAWDALPESSHARVHALLKTCAIQELVDNGVLACDVYGPSATILQDRMAEVTGPLLGALIEQRPDRQFLEAAILTLAESNSFRAAEQNMETLVLPLADAMDNVHVGKVLDAIRENRQVHQAGRMPGLLVRFFDDTRHVLAAGPAWLELGSWLVKQADVSDYYTYPELRQRLEGIPPF